MIPLSHKNRRLVKTTWGFYQYDPMPYESELKRYYEEQYYQKAEGSYEISYTPEETAYWKLKAWLIYRKSSELRAVGGTTVLDVGCGEGWYMDEFSKHGCRVWGLDFSRYAIEKFHPHLTKFFEQGNMYTLLDQRITSQVKSDIIILSNVLEHVVDPVGLLNKIKSIMSEQALLIVHSPNDFSPLQEHLLQKGFISRRFWVDDYPEHLSFFNKESMQNLVEDLGFTLQAVVADNAIDLNLFNKNSNYVEDKSKGKGTHFLRVYTDNFLASIDREKLLRMREILGSMGVGRGLTYYCMRKV